MRYIQIAELAGYISQSRPEPERATYVQSIQQRLAVEEGQTHLADDIARRREVFSVVLRDVKGLGDGTERGRSQLHCCVGVAPFHALKTEIEGFFNLLYAHLLALWPVGSPETKKHVSDLLPIITSSAAQSSIRYRMCVSCFAVYIDTPKCLSLSKPLKFIQCTPTKIRAPPPCLQGAPRTCKFKSRAARAPCLPC
jgi:translation initiation factor 3 subunit M